MEAVTSKVFIAMMVVFHRAPQADGQGFGFRVTRPPSTVIKAAFGENHQCQLHSDGTVKCSGQGGDGQLGNGMNKTSSEYVNVFGITDAVDVCAAKLHSCAVLENGAVACWGSDIFGSLGQGYSGNFLDPRFLTTFSLSRSLIPVEVHGLENITQVNCWGYQTCALRADGVLLCWGERSMDICPAWDGPAQGYAVPGGTSGRGRLPGPVAGHPSDPITKFSVGLTHICVVLQSGRAWCWGCGEQGQLGNNNITNEAIDISVLDYYSCAALRSGSVLCWGSADIRYNRSMTVNISGFTRAVGLTCGLGGCCGTTVSGSIYCWTARPCRTQDLVCDAPLAGNRTCINGSGFISGGRWKGCASKSGESPFCWTCQQYCFEDTFQCRTTTRMPTTTTVVTTTLRRTWYTTTVTTRTSTSTRTVRTANPNSKPLGKVVPTSTGQVAALASSRFFAVAAIFGQFVALATF